MRCRPQHLEIADHDNGPPPGAVLREQADLARVFDVLFRSACTLGVKAAYVLSLAARRRILLVSPRPRPDHELRELAPRLDAPAPDEGGLWC